MVQKPRASYSQAAEDLIIELLLQRSSNLHYIDIGCLWPVKLSNTYLFYLNGGSGLCIDPNPDVAAEFATVRPRDIFVNAGVSSTSANMVYSMFENPVFNTFDSARREKVLRKSRPGRRLVKEIPVDVKPLDRILEEVGWWDKAPKTDFLSIDVEGHELEVLKSAPLGRLAPELVVCEQFGAVEHIAASPIAIFLREAGYHLIAATGHDCFFRRGNV